MSHARSFRPNSRYSFNLDSGNKMLRDPDKNLSAASLKLSGVSILVVGPTGKTIVSFGVKEGERKALAGKVSFADVDPVDLANYPAFGEK